MVQMQLNSAHLPIIGKGGQGKNICKWGLIQDQAPRQAPGVASDKKRRRKHEDVGVECQ